ncbi:reverse gyrase [Desulfurobacterium atlanticum]|uniref:Reverse gyrase n=1 Tax=Desulfurobacterium atlanticum TaxID=240169 RepID=A0A238YJ54_9BACT|nr:reverse gyrase [Desulfurobacterium atlanticum]SNR71090.1 Reverse gyrase [Desulfurobacterium atlanticum]
MKIAYFRRMCPNCGGIIGDDRLSLGLVCEKCLPDAEKEITIRELCSILKKKSNEIKKLCDVESFVNEFQEFFKEKTGFSPWSLQIVWAKRVALGRSFSLIAPTGIGKTTWGIVASAFLEGRSYIVVPTKILVEQIFERVSAITDKNVLAYTGKKREKEKIFQGEFDVLITTTNFLYRNYEKIPSNFKFIFIDDVDSVLKSGKNIDKILKVAGFSDDAISTALEVITLKSKLASVKDEKIRERLLKKIAFLEKKLDSLKKRVDTVLVVSSATSSPKSKRVKLFRELLDFEVGKVSTTLRNVEDVVVLPEKDILEEGINFIKKYGKGVFVFITEVWGKEFVNNVVDLLNSNGIRAVSYENFSVENYDDFRKGKIEAVVGIASYKNPLARGIDIPDAVRYAVFLGVPGMKFLVDFSLAPQKLFSIILACREFLDAEKVVFYLNYLRKYRFMKEEEVEKYPALKSKLEEISTYLKEKFADSEFIKKLKESDSVFLTQEDGNLYLIVGDAVGYIQASGRTSRMFAGGLTKGVSFLLVDDLKAFNSLRKRVSILYKDMEFKVFANKKGIDFANRKGLSLIDEESLKKIFAEVDKDRERVKRILKGELACESRELVKATLVVVESPHKARTIASFFGTPMRRRIGDIDVYEVSSGDRLFAITASKGHLFDLSVKDGRWGVVEENSRFLTVYDTIKRCSVCGYQTVEGFCPKCKKNADIDRKETVEALRDTAIEIDEIFVASDPDTEGEKIAWDVGINLKPLHRNVKRAEFHEITPKAFITAVNNPRNVDINLVKAQLVRRVADRWVGFSLSQNLQKFFGKKWLSAGRVQTPVLGWVIERADKSKEKKKKILLVHTDILSITFEKVKEIFDGEHYLKFKLIERGIEEKNPFPPFNTGELIKAASYELNFSADETMNLAQELFELGFITYHRTDSIRVSSAGISVAKEYICSKFGEEFFKPRVWGEGGAHECIRPVRPLSVDEIRTSLIFSSVSLSIKHLKLYDLIFRRFMASQMRAFEVKYFDYKFILEPENLEKEERFYGEIVKNGWNLILPVILPQIPKNLFEEGKIKIQFLEVKEIPVVYPFTQGELVEEMRERGIGRPSTYAKIVQTLLDRKYVVERGKFLYPTSLGRKVFQYLSTNFPDYVSEEFTRELENLMDRVERGEVDYQKVIKELKAVLKFAEIIAMEETVDR